MKEVEIHCRLRKGLESDFRLGNVLKLGNGHTISRTLYVIYDCTLRYRHEKTIFRDCWGSLKNREFQPQLGSRNRKKSIQ